MCVRVCVLPSDPGSTRIGSSRHWPCVGEEYMVLCAMLCSTMASWPSVVYKTHHT